ncbi:MAG: Ig-like domain-containing protein, partial [Cyanobacteria bacterium J06607_6]
TTGTVAVTVNNVNEAPVAVEDTATTDEDVAIDVPVLTNDTDADGDELSVTAVGAATNGEATLSEDGTVTYTPNAGFSGEDTFTYTVSDGTEETTGSVAVTVNNVNEAPVAVEDTATTDEDLPVTITVLANDTDADADELTVTAVGTATNGEVVINEDGTVTYTPTAGFSGEDSFTYTISDGSEEVTASVAVTVNNLNEAPVANEDTATTEEDAPVTIEVLANDTDADADELTVTAVGTPTSGTAAINDDGTVTYTPTVGFSGEDSFTYTVSDGSEEVTGSVAVTVTNINEAPVAVEDTATTEEDTPVVIEVLANDTDADADDKLSITAVDAAPNGTVDINEDGTVTYTPTAGFNGEDTFTYTISDGLEESTAAVTVTVTGFNEAPVAVDDIFEGEQGINISGNVLSNDSDPNGDVLIVGLSDTDSVENGILELNQDGSFVYVPNEGFTGTDGFSYVLSDGLLTDTAAVTLNINGNGGGPGTPTTLGLFDYEEFLRFEGISAVAPADEVGGLALAQLFDERFYLDQNPDVLAAVSSGQLSSGYAHFVSAGISEGRAPSILYDEVFYLEMNADVAAAVNEGSLSSGLTHFLNVGHLENRDPSSVFSQEDYLTNNPDISAAVDNGLIGSGFEHFVESGAEENRLPLSLYDESFYLANNPDVAAAVASGQLPNGFEHFVVAGQSEGRAPSSLYNEASYLSLNADVAAGVTAGSFSSGFDHYEQFGRFEGRPVFA